MIAQIRALLVQAALGADGCTSAPGTFVYLKRLTAEAVELEATLFALRVRREMERWREKKALKRRWFTIKEAARRAQEPELQAHIQNAKKLFAAHP